MKTTLKELHQRQTKFTAAGGIRLYAHRPPPIPVFQSHNPLISNAEFVDCLASVHKCSAGFNFHSTFRWCRSSALNSTLEYPAPGCSRPLQPVSNSAFPM